ncbi:MAG: type II secretion system protein GspN [Deltaproteobacteria bacterium HGW-Deltaproteobacteria-14]|jgi:type II secretion system protein N|nr:MAG: type II secretion system protein GspN [Deltaproteobacteria bacterium HGW-Deltaproteobacteria-14]
MKTALRWFGYVLFFLLCTAVFVYLTFPTDQARRFAEVKLTELSGADSVTIADLSLAGIGGAHLDDISIELPTLKIPTAVPGVEEEGPLRLIMVKTLDVDASLGGFLFGGDVDVTFDAEAQGGTIKRGHYQRDKEGTNVIEIGAIEDVALGSEQLFQALVGKNITGLVSGSLNVTLHTIAGANGKPAIDLDNVVGQIDLEIKDAKLRAPIFDSPMGRIQLGDADLGTIILKVVVDRASNIEAFKKTARRAGSDNTILHIADASVDGDDIAIQVAKNSAITLTAGRPLKDAAVNIHLSIMVKDAFFDREVPDPKDPKKKTQPNKNLRFVMQQPPIKNVLENGVFGVGITGILGKPRIRVERSVIREGIASRRPNLDRPVVDPEDDAEDADVEPEPPTPAPAPARVIDRPAPMRDAKTRFGASRPQPGRAALRPGIQARPTTLPPGTPPLHQLQPPPIPVEPDPVTDEPEGEVDPNGEPLEGEVDPNGEPLEHPEGELVPEDETIPE